MGARDGAGQSCVQTGPNVFTDLHREHGGRFVVLVEKESHSLLCSPMRDPPGGVIGIRPCNSILSQERLLMLKCGYE